MRAVVFATAGHIDHGKTSLVAALTGVWCDRLKEEQERGITLVLGFAPLPDPGGDLEVAFVDVPGHERLVHTMLAGAGGGDRALLVVAANEGVMPQTREHVAILDLLGVQGGVVALTKADTVTPEELEARKQELEDFLAGGPLEGSPVVACSAKTLEGIEALRQAILQVARNVQRPPDPFRPFRLGADRVFTLPGAGTVVTGTARWGQVAVGQEVWVFPPGKQFRVKTLQVHGQPRREAFAGERVALALAGAKVEEIPRGAQLLSPGPWEPRSRCVAELTLLPEARPLEEGAVLWFFLLAGRTLCRLERLYPTPAQPGSKVRAILRFAKPVFLAPQDRFVLRQPSPPRTVGGGVVLDVEAPRLRRSQASALATLVPPWVSLGGTLERWVEEAGPGGVRTAELASRLALLPEGLEAPLGQLHGEKRVVLVGEREVWAISRAAVEAALGKAKGILGEAGALGVSGQELFAQLGVGEVPAVRSFYLRELKVRGIAREEGGKLLAAEGAGLPPLAVALEELYEKAGLEAPSPHQAAEQLAAPLKQVEAMVAVLLRQGRLVRLGGKWLVHRSVVERVVAGLASWGKETFQVGEFKERFGLTRKLAIPLLEWLDSQRITRREGDRRRILATAGGRSWSGSPATPRP